MDLGLETFKLCTPCLKYNEKHSVEMRKKVILQMFFNPNDGKKINQEKVDKMILIHKNMIDHCNTCFTACMGDEKCVRQSRKRVLKIQIENAKTMSRLFAIKCKTLRDQRYCGMRKKLEDQAKNLEAKLNSL